MAKPQRIAFVKFCGLSAGGTERWLQEMAIQLSRDHEVTFFYCDTAPYTGSDFHHPGTDEERKAYMEQSDVHLVEFVVGEKDITSPIHPWRETNFWEVFDERQFDLVHTATAGPAEYPYCLLETPVVEFVSLDAGANEYPDNVIHTVHLSEWQRERWAERGGTFETSSVISIPVMPPATSEDMRSALGVPDVATVAGFHQRAQDEIFSPIPLDAFSRLSDPDLFFLIMGGSDLYRSQAARLGVGNVRFIDHSADPVEISRFLNTLDVYAHGRRDGETFGTVLAEALMHGKPCLSHASPVANAQPETMGPHGIFAADEAEYERELRELVTDPGKREALAEGAQAFAASRYSVDSCGYEIRSLYAGFGPNPSPPRRRGQSRLKPKALTPREIARSLLSEWKRLRVRQAIRRERRHRKLSSPSA